MRLYFSLTTVVFAVSLVVGCSGGSGEPIVQYTNDGSDNADSGGVVYKGPAPANADVTNFKLYVWDNLAREDRCGACHIEGGQSPQFVRFDDINLAYAETNPLVVLSSPSESRLAQKVGGGHNCWQESATACEDTIITMITNWATESGAEAAEIVLSAPVKRPVSASRSFPEDSGSFATTVYPILRSVGGCAGCHAEDGAQMQQQPYFASADVDAAYLASKSKISLSDFLPSNAGLVPQPLPQSRFIARLRDERHNCWVNPDTDAIDCAHSATTMANAIRDFLVGIPEESVDEDLVVSDAVALINDGIVASSGGRFQSNAIALYEFKPDGGSIAADTSAVDPALNLRLSGDARLLDSWGLDLNGGKAQGSTADSKKLFDILTATSEYSIEAWVIPGNVTQDNSARIVSYSGGSDARNFTLGQTLYNYDFLARSSLSDANGMPMLSTPDADEVLQATQQHVVVSFDAVNGRSIYVNGELRARDPEAGANFNDWNDTFVLALGNEVDNLEPWQGTIRFLAIHKRVLTEEQILQNYSKGVGQKYYLLFGVSDLVDMPQAYIVFTAEIFDEYSYLLTDPFFISLDGEAVPPGTIEIEGIRIGINGKEARVGQFFGNVDVSITSANYNASTGFPLARGGAVIALEKGADNGGDASNNDLFFLSFDRIGSFSYDRPADPVPAPELDSGAGEQPDIGVRHFAEVNGSLSALTGVPVTDSGVTAVYELVKQQMPVDENIEGFLASHQAGVMQLAVAYCTSLVGDTSRRATFFPGFDFGLPVSTAFAGGNESLIIDPLLNALLVNEIDLPSGTLALSTQPNSVEATMELSDLVDQMSGAEDTPTAVIATCAAAFGSAVMLVQ